MQPFRPLGVAKFGHRRMTVLFDLWPQPYEVLFLSQIRATHPPQRFYILATMSRTLTFNVGQLTKDVQVVFVVQAPTNGKIGDGYYLAWRIAELKAGGNSDDRFTVEYPASLGIATAGITKIKPGQSTTLALDGEVRFWSEPTKIGGNTIQAINRTGGFQGIALGTVNDQNNDFPLSPTFLWDVGAEMTAETDFSPNLMMFVNLYCEKGGVIFDDPPESECIWKVNLNAQDPVTDWKFEETPQVHPLKLFQLIKMLPVTEHF
ncbi:hypothetical protein L218DRAFT_949015 [Marasmius fiardii PR-910]|nr:hypothetical protein L218DRAFT_949015 [Marasmius fiardii PR-910]